MEERITLVDMGDVVFIADKELKEPLSVLKVEGVKEYLQKIPSNKTITTTLTTIEIKYPYILEDVVDNLGESLEKKKIQILEVVEFELQGKQSIEVISFM